MILKKNSKYNMIFQFSQGNLLMWTSVDCSCQESISLYIKMIFISLCLSSFAFPLPAGSINSHIFIDSCNIYWAPNMYSPWVKRTILSLSGQFFRYFSYEILAIPLKHHNSISLSFHKNVCIFLILISLFWTFLYLLQCMIITGWKFSLFVM